MGAFGKQTSFNRLLVILDRFPQSPGPVHTHLAHLALPRCTVSSRGTKALISCSSMARVPGDHSLWTTLPYRLMQEERTSSRD